MRDGTPTQHDDASSPSPPSPSVSGANENQCDAEEGISSQRPDAAQARRSAVDAELAKLGKLTPLRREDELAAIAKRLGYETTPATLADVVEHLEHVIKIAGVDHVGIGSDFDGVNCVPVGLDDVSKFPALTRALLERGHSAGDIQKIYGGNLLRVMRAVEKAAKP